MDTRYSPINEIFFSIQLFGGVLLHSVGAAACSLAAALAVHACGQMAVLECWLYTDGVSLPEDYGGYSLQSHQ